jgi:hypothetical protein
MESMTSCPQHLSTSSGFVQFPLTRESGTWTVCLGLLSFMGSVGVLSLLLDDQFYEHERRGAKHMAWVTRPPGGGQITLQLATDFASDT